MAGFFSYITQANEVFRTQKNCFKGINILPTIQLFNLLFGITVLCVTFVDIKSVADDKYVHGICSVVCNEF